jgi:hypothetical protein
MLETPAADKTDFAEAKKSLLIAKVRQEERGYREACPQELAGEQFAAG